MTAKRTSGGRHRLSIDDMHDRRGSKWARQLDHFHGDLRKHLTAPARDGSVRLFCRYIGLDADSRPQVAQSFDVAPGYVVLEAAKDALAKPHAPEGFADF